MNVFKKSLVLFASILIIIGIISIIVGFAFGGRLLNFNLSKLTDFDSSYTSITSLDIDISAGEINIVEGDEFKIEAINVRENAFSSEVKNGVWTISDKESRKTFFHGYLSFGYLNWGDNETKITLYLPKNIELDKTTIDLGAGQMNIDLLTTENLILNDSSVNCGVGSIYLNLTGDPDSYDYDIDVGLGTVKINDSSYSGVSSQKINNPGSIGIFKLDCGVGEIDIQLSE